MIRAHRTLSMVAVLLAAMLLATACGDSGGDTADESTEADTAAEETAEDSTEATEDTADEATDGGETAEIPEEYQDMVLVGSSQGGSGYNWMVAASQVFNQVLGMNTSVQAGGTQENALLMDSGELEFAITAPGDAISATGSATAVQDAKYRTLWNIFNVSWALIVAPDVEAESLADLVGRRIAIGIPGGGEHPLFMAAIECAGLSESDFQLQPIGKDEAVAAYKDGNIDAWAAQGPNPTPQFVEVIESPRGGRLVPIGDDVLECLVEGSDEFVLSEIPAGTYPGQDEALPTVDEWFYAVVQEDMPEDVAYTLAKALDENYDQLVRTFPGATTSTAEATAEAQGFKLHPGTERYLTEKGLLRP